MIVKPIVLPVCCRLCCRGANLLITFGEEGAGVASWGVALKILGNQELRRWQALGGWRTRVPAVSVRARRINRSTSSC